MDDLSKETTRDTAPPAGDLSARSISRRGAIKAAVAAGAAIYAVPAIDTLTGGAIAHAASAPPTTGGPFITTCGGSAMYPGVNAATATLTITPCQTNSRGEKGNRVTITDGTFTESGTAADTALGSTVSEIEFDSSHSGLQCAVIITNVVTSCAETPSSAQTVQIVCFDSSGTPYQRSTVALSSGKVSTAMCP